MNYWYVKTFQIRIRIFQNNLSDIRNTLLKSTRKNHLCILSILEKNAQFKFAHFVKNTKVWTGSMILLLASRVFIPYAELYGITFNKPLLIHMFYCFMNYVMLYHRGRTVVMRLNNYKTISLNLIIIFFLLTVSAQLVQEVYFEELGTILKKN